MSEKKRPKRYALEGIDRGKFFYYTDEADAYIAALERRARIAERAFENEWVYLHPEVLAEKFEQATREIDAELAKEQAKEETCG